MECEDGAFLMLVVIALVLLALGRYISVQEDKMDNRGLSQSIYDVVAAVASGHLTADEATDRIEELIGIGPVSAWDAVAKMTEIAKSNPNSALGGA